MLGVELTDSRESIIHSTLLCSQQYPGAAGAQTTMYQLEVPSGVGPGQQFQAQVGDSMMVITCPAGAGPGSTIQARAHPRASGLPAGRTVPCPPNHLEICSTASVCPT